MNDVHKKEINNITSEIYITDEVIYLLTFWYADEPEGEILFRKMLTEKHLVLEEQFTLFSL